MKNINQIIRDLPPQRRAKISSRANELIGEEMALQHVRKALDLTQEQMAKLLGIGQDSVSRIESRSDMLISTLQSYIEAMGGSLKVIAEFPDGRVSLSGLGCEQTKRSKRPAPTKRPTQPRRKLRLAHAEA
ncbi:helix-turn-helix domain-containing protein [Bradyrhizobium icense]|uniref:helix-turn-helix domain-containing protein n=1 Tax=Bradyrhizobium icense TaxID=1274631 RepID=UPI0009F307BD|nr:helix-turn-helix domain-containing protein [Bradyrhizobium icense]